MKKLLVILSSSLLIFSCATQKQSGMSQTQKGNPVIAHRGAFKKNGLPENSIAALREAIRLQCAGSEFDVHMTADDSLVINHDPRYHGLEIEKSTYAQLAAFPLSNGEPLPTLHRFLLAGKENNSATKLVLEIKPSIISKERGKAVAEKCLAMVKELGTTSLMAYISFDYDILKRVHELNPKAPTQYLNGDKTPDQLKADGLSGADYHFSVFQKNPDWIRQAKEKGLVLNAWTVNNRSDMEWLLKSGFHYITTNEPELLFAVISEGYAKQ
jgi:glycerophosphoryl diester phosphodiesterase